MKKRKSSGTGLEAAVVTNMLSMLVEGVLSGASKNTKKNALVIGDSVVSEATQFGADILKKVIGGVEHRPLAILAVAASAGYIFGLSQRD